MGKLVMIADQDRLDELLQVHHLDQIDLIPCLIEKANNEVLADHAFREASRGLPILLIWTDPSRRLYTDTRGNTKHWSADDPMGWTWLDRNKKAQEVYYEKIQNPIDDLYRLVELSVYLDDFLSMAVPAHGFSLNLLVPYQREYIRRKLNPATLVEGPDIKITVSS